MTKALVGLLASVLVLVPAGPGLEAQNIGQVARVEDFVPGLIETVEYPHYSDSGERIDDASWRVVQGTGNCCENYLAATSRGKLVDFGGTYLNFSDDMGLTWKRVRPIEPMINGEGAVALGPGGDILGVAWEPYSGDRVVAFKYDASDEEWYFVENLVHTPFFDREWVSAIPGPFTIAGQTVPYLTIMTGSIYKELWYYSLDGLNYFLPSSKLIDEVTGETVNRPLDLPRFREADWIQPLSSFNVTPLNGGGALARDVSGIMSNQWALLGPSELRWSKYEWPGKPLPPGRVMADSRGRLHYVSILKGRQGFDYRISSDGGRSWVDERIYLPHKHRVEQWDFKAHARLGVSAVAIHARNRSRKTDQDLLYKFDNRNGPRFTDFYYLGLGDQSFGRGIASNEGRFDFATVTIFPDGRIATSFVDSTHRNPAVAIQLAD